MFGEVGVLDRIYGPVFEKVRTEEGFKQVRVDTETSAMCEAGRASSP
jgi:hypothetical protein